MERKIGLYLATMVVLHGFLFYREWPRVRQGFPDFSIFYTAAQIIHQGEGAQIYSDGLQEVVQRSFASAVGDRGSILPFNHPPFEAVVFWPFAKFSFLSAYLLWFAINVAMLLVLMGILRKALSGVGQRPLWIWLLAVFGFTPLMIALLQGQDSIWVLLCYCFAFAAWRKGNEARSGIWFGLALCKFHLVLPFLLGPLLQKRWKMIAAFVATGVGLLAVSLPIVGWKAVMQYPQYVWWTDHVQKFGWNFLHSNTPNVRGMVLGLLPNHLWARGEVVVIAISVVLVMLSAYFWLVGADSPGRELAFAGSVVATVLVSYHTWVQDLSLLFLPMLVLLDIQCKLGMSARSERIAWALMAILFCAPVYLILILRYQQLHIITWVVLLLLAVIWARLVAYRGDARATVSET